MASNIKLPIIIGPTASGKTRLAALCASKLGAEIISADSRQVYRGMDIGTGKDYDDYIIDNIKIPYHLIDIVDAGYAYNVFEFKRDFAQAFTNITKRGKTPMVCGGTGLYAESVIKQYELQEVPQDIDFRAACEKRDLEDLIEELKNYKIPHNTSDFDTKKRVIRALEIARYEQTYGAQKHKHELLYNTIVIGVHVSRETRRNRIEARLKQRMQQGMTDEVETLLSNGVRVEQLLYYGLEYKYITLYITGALTKQQMIDDLFIAICQFSKRQMTWFRGMERRGIHIHWIDGEQSMEERVGRVLEVVGKV